MTEVLSQNEIEALLAAMTTVENDREVGEGNTAVKERMGAVTPTAKLGRTTAGKVLLPLHKRRRAEAGQALGDPRFSHLNSGTLSYEPYDFRRPDKLSKEHLRSLQILHETFANYFASSLAAYLRSQVQINVVSVEQVPYDEYMKSISASLLNILTVSPLSGQAILEIDFGIIFSMLDRLLGGNGQAGKVIRDLTDIERSLAATIVQHGLNDLKIAWSNVSPLEFEVASAETSSQFVQIVPGNDTVVLILFEIRLGEQQGAMSICIPYLLIKPILNKLSAQRWFMSVHKRSPLYAKQLADRLNTTRVNCVARLGQTSLTVNDLSSLKIGQILPMSISADASCNPANGSIGSVDLVVGGEVKFHGKTGLRGRKLAVLIEQVAKSKPSLIANRES